MQRIVWGLVVITIAVLAGCGGGGGALSITTTPATLSPLHNDTVETQQVENSDLPNDGIFTQEDGNAEVEIVNPQKLDDDSSDQIDSIQPPPVPTFDDEADNDYDLPPPPPFINSEDTSDMPPLPLI